MQKSRLCTTPALQEGASTALVGYLQRLKYGSALLRVLKAEGTA